GGASQSGGLPRHPADMRTLLRIDASARTHGSHSRRLADEFERRWRQSHPDGRMLRRDLAVFEVPHLASETIAAFVSPEASGPPRPGSGAAISDELIEELSAAD